MEFFGLKVIFRTPYRVSPPSHAPLILAQLAQRLVGIINRMLLLFPSNICVQVSVVSTLASNRDAADDCNIVGNSVASGSKNATTPAGKVRL